MFLFNQVYNITYTEALKMSYWIGRKRTVIMKVRKFAHSPKKFGKIRTLSVKEELVMCLMKLLSGGGGLLLVPAPSRGPALLPCSAAGDERSSERESSTGLGVSWIWPSSVTVVVSSVAAGDGSIASFLPSRTAMGLRRAWRSPESDSSSRGTVVTVGMWLFRPLSSVFSGVFD